MTENAQQPPQHPPRRVLLLGATGTIGRAVHDRLKGEGFQVTCLVRANSHTAGLEDPRPADLADPASLATALGDARFDAMISCMASRTGTPADAWAVDYRAHSIALQAARELGVSHMVLLSAICVQKPALAFQQAKLAFEAELQASGITYSIVRPTAYFKSLTGQLDRLRRGKPYLIFGDGELTRCKPISDRDLAHFMVNCLDDRGLQNAVLPIGGPGPAISPREIGTYMAKRLGIPPRFKSVTPRLLVRIAGLLDGLGRLWPRLRQKAALARIGHYYATESMLVWNPDRQCYDADATPEFGEDSLFAHIDQLVANDSQDARGDHSVF